jgi:hypothetical protein
MDKLENLLTRFNEIAYTHPNLAKLWIHYLSVKKEKISFN